MGYIAKKQRKNGLRYYAVYRDPSCRKRWEGGFKLKKDAQKLLKRREAEVAAGTYGREDITFRDFYVRWMESKAKSLKPSTKASYEHTFRLHIIPYFGGKHLSKIKPLDIQGWVNEMTEKDLASATVGRCYRYLRACLKQAESWDLIPKSPCRSINLPRENHEELSFLGPDEIRTLLEEAREPERTFFALLAFSGLRTGEALGLAWKHIDLNDKAIFVERAWSYQGGFQEPKTVSSRRAVPLVPTLATILGEHYKAKENPPPDTLLFSFSGKQPLDPSNVRKEYERALDAAGLKHVTLHSLRHSFASMMLESGCSIKALQRSLGHASATMTLNVYSHLIGENIGDSMLKFDALVSTAGNNLVHIKEYQKT